MARKILIVAVILVLLLATAAGYLVWKNQPREQTVEDTAIILRTLVLLERESDWLKEASDCKPGQMLTLYCALRQASIDVTGEYHHRAAALQEVRHSIDDLYPGNGFAHRLKDFNNAPNVTLEDVHYVLRHALTNLEQKWNQ